MPFAAPKVCTKPGCGVLVQDGDSRCPAHRQALQAARDQVRGNSAARGYGHRWQQARAGFLRAHPLCLAHQLKGDAVAATEVDHIKPHRGDMSLFWQRSNWQPLCKSCHSSKTAREDGRFGSGNPWRGF